MPKLFFSYSHKDEEMRDALEKHLSMLIREGLITTIHDRRILAGENLDDAISSHIKDSKIILCLLSPDFIASDYCYSNEMQVALDRHNRKEACVIPVILRYCEWKKTPLSKLNGTPRDNKPIKAWADQDEAMLSVTESVRASAESLGLEASYKEAPHRTPAEDGATYELRSSNMQISRVFNDYDRDTFVRTSFEHCVEFITNSVSELEERHSNIQGNATRIDENRFTAALYKDGKKTSAISIFIGRQFSNHEINFNLSDRADTNLTNGGFRLIDGRGNLAFSSNFHDGNREQRNLNVHSVSELLWMQLIKPLQED